LTEQKKRLIEVSLPLKAISAQSAREKSIRHGHISTPHIWWTWKRKRLRRPLATMSAVCYNVCVETLVFNTHVKIKEVAI
jgi:putative DNA methylase